MLKNIILKSIRFYQKTAIFRHPILKSLFLTDAVCKYQPTCSEYSYQAIEKYGIIRGSLMTLKRIIKCHPLSKGGKDPVK